MNKNESYSGIDIFRMIAAILVVAIHISPLADISTTGDFVLTRVVARVAVPFFFMTSGFFLLKGDKKDKLLKFVKKTAIIYAVAIILYIPINIYNGYFKQERLAFELIKDIIFDGTMYHLWYLPASIVGAVIAWFLVKKLNYGIAFTVSGLLYLVGLFGDSYFGLSEKVSGLKGFYDAIFKVCDYTRNGILFAPLFFVLGGFLAEKAKKLSMSNSLVGFAASFGLMLSEALTLHFYKLQRHDSMYVFLPVTMYFLFSFLMQFRGKRYNGLRTSSLVVYIVHPLMIVVVRIFAKTVHLQSLLIDNVLAQYFAVCAASVVFAVIFTFVWTRFISKKSRA